MKYRKKPVEIYALKFVPEKWDGSAPPEFHEAVEIDFQGIATIKTLEGTHLVTSGDFVIRGVKGEFYPCKPDIFEMTYEKVE